MEDNKYPKVTLNFDSYRNAKIAMNGELYKEALEELWDILFRPLYKHGYADKFLDSEEHQEIIYKTIDKLAKKYQEYMESLRYDLEE